MKYLNYAQLTKVIERMFKHLSKIERHQNPDIVDKSNDIIRVLSKKKRAGRIIYDKEPIPHMPFELCHPALGNIPRA